MWTKYPAERPKKFFQARLNTSKPRATYKYIFQIFSWLLTKSSIITLPATYLHPYSELGPETSRPTIIHDIFEAYNLTFVPGRFNEGVKKWRLLVPNLDPLNLGF